MRKILSIFLTVAMTLSLFAAIPFGTSAEQTVSSALTFDTDEQKSYYNSNPGKNSTADVIITDTDQGYAFKYTVLDNEWEGTSESVLRIAQPQADGSVSAYKVKAGRTYTISFKYKNDSAVNSWGFYTKLLFVNQYNNMGNLLSVSCEGSLGNWQERISLPDLVITSGSDTQAVTNGWQNYSASFYVPKSIVNDEIALIFAIDSGKNCNNASFWVDDILVQEADDNGIFKMDFQSDAAKVFYADTNNSQKFEIAQTWQSSEDDLGMKFTSVAGCDSSTTTTPVFRLSQTNENGTVTPITVKAGESYELSIDYKNDWEVDTWGCFYVKLMYIDGTQSVQGLKGNQVNIWKDWDAAYRVDLEGNNTFPNEGDSGWQTYTFSFTVPEVADEKQLAIGVINGTDVASCCTFFDNIVLTRKENVVIHNDSLENSTYTTSVLSGTATKDIQLPVAGSNITRLYTDAARTQLYTGTTVNESLELWADIESVTCDFDNYVFANDYWGDTNFYIEQYSGTVNSNAITDKGHPNMSNSSFPPTIKLTDGNGNQLKTVIGHTYTLDFDIAVENVNSINDSGWVVLCKKANTTSDPNNESNGIVDAEFAYTGTNDELTSNYLKSLFDNADDMAYRHVHYEFAGTGDQCNIAAYLAGTAVYIDNIKIVDVTAQIAVKDDNETTLASGYDGETVEVPDADNSDFVYYADENGTPVASTVVRTGKTLTKVNSVIAVNATEFDSEKNTVSFKTRFGGMEYETSGTNVTVKTVTDGNRKYIVEDMGLLVVPTANVTGELTLDNLCGAENISENLKYSVSGTNELTVTAEIAVNNNYNRDYTVVGYIKCLGGKVIYGKMRNSIAKSYNAAAGIEAVDNSVHTKSFDNGVTSYRLVSNSEFNSSESLSNGWHTWGYVENPNSSDNSAESIDYYSVDSATYTDNTGNLVLDLKKTSDKTFDLPKLVSYYYFTTGYVEVKAKFANTTDLSGAIWLNGATISNDYLSINPSETDIYVKPEIDIVEFSKTSEFYFTLHNWGTNSEGDFGQNDQIRLKNNDADVSELDLTQEHRYGLERTSEVIRMYVDDTLYYELTYDDALKTYHTDKGKNDYQYRTENEVKALFENPMYLILGTGGAQSLAVGESATSTIDYVRFYK